MGVADDHSIVAKQSVEQTRLTCIGRSVNHHAHAFAQNATLIGGREQRGNLFENAIEPGAQCFAFIWRNALLGKIDRRIDVRQ